MKLCLLSTAIQPSHVSSILKLVGKNHAEDVSIALIENAADPYEEDKKGFLQRDRDGMLNNGFTIDFVDLNDYKNKVDELRKRLEASDIVWLSGGNTYYLRWILRETGADKVISELVRNGKVYGGSSAGAIATAKTIDNFQTADSPDMAPEVILDGLGFVDFIPLPHWANEKFGERMLTIREKFQKAGYETIEITDEQALIVDGDKRTIV